MVLVVCFFCEKHEEKIVFTKMLIIEQNILFAVRGWIRKH